VTVNGTWRGRTPLTLGALKFGAYNVRVVEHGFAVASQEVTLSAAQPSRAVSFRLQPGASAESSARPVAPAPKLATRAGPASTGQMYVASRPSGAQVLLDGRVMGSTPMRIPDIPAGAHLVRLELPGYRSLSIRTQVSAAKETPVTASLERIQ
jgi:hypothetical protein